MKHVNTFNAKQCNKLKIKTEVFKKKCSTVYVRTK